jgi:hypothetical protein
VSCQDPTKLWNWISEFPKFKQANVIQEAKAKHYQGVIETMVDTESPRAAFNAINQLEIKRVDLGAERLDDNQLVIALLDATTRSRNCMTHLQYEIWAIRNGSKPACEQIEPEGGETKVIKKFTLIEAERLLTTEHEAHLARQLKFEQAKAIQELIYSRSPQLPPARPDELQQGIEALPSVPSAPADHRGLHINAVQQPRKFIDKAAKHKLWLSANPNHNQYRSPCDN